MCFGAAVSRVGDQTDLVLFNVSTSHTPNPMLLPLRRLCDYLNQNRDSLLLDSKWNQSTDCLGYSSVRQVNRTLRTIFTAGEIESGMIGMGKQKNLQWVCSNTSVMWRHPLTPAVSRSILRLWEDALAQATGTSISQDFAFVACEDLKASLFHSQQENGLLLSVIAFVAGSLVLVFTLTRNWRISLLLLLTSVTSWSTSVCAVSFVFAHREINGNDVVASALVWILYVSFPLQLTLAVLRVGSDVRARETVVQRVRASFVVPLLGLELCGVSLLFSPLALHVSLGRAIIVSSFLSFSLSAFLLPTMLSLPLNGSCQSLCPSPSSPAKRTGLCFLWSCCLNNRTKALREYIPSDEASAVRRQRHPHDPSDGEGRKDRVCPPERAYVGGGSTRGKNSLGEFV